MPYRLVVLFYSIFGFFSNSQANVLINDKIILEPAV